MFNKQAEIRINNLNVEMIYTHKLLYAYYFLPVLF